MFSTASLQGFSFFKYEDQVLMKTLFTNFLLTKKNIKIKRYQKYLKFFFFFSKFESLAQISENQTKIVTKIERKEEDYQVILKLKKN
jgi:hypothetical protein